MDDQEKQLDQLCTSYSNYLKVDTSRNVKTIEDTIEETLTRLEEFETILLMMRSSAEGQLTTALLDKKEDLMKTCQKVRFLEEIVYKLRQEVDTMEAKLSAAEAELKNSSQTTLQNILKPLLFMRPESSGVTSPSRRDLSYTPHPVLSVDQFFHDNSQAS